MKSISGLLGVQERAGVWPSGSTGGVVWPSGTFLSHWLCSLASASVGFACLIMCGSRGGGVPLGPDSLTSCVDLSQLQEEADSSLSSCTAPSQTSLKGKGFTGSAFSGSHQSQGGFGSGTQGPQLDCLPSLLEFHGCCYCDPVGVTLLV